MSKTKKHTKKYKKNSTRRTRKISKNIVSLNKSLKTIIKKLTGKPFRGTIGVVSKSVLNNTTPFISKIPIAGNTIVYLFKKSEKSLYIVLTTVDNMVDSGGNIITSAMDGATNLTVLVLNMGK
tara:strand:+ start:938 stop:1306 length:369 start_codon:yes stop_codon:yes gene_type:complete